MLKECKVQKAKATFVQGLSQMQYGQVPGRGLQLLIV